MWRWAVLSLSLPLVLITFAAGLTVLAGTRLTYLSGYLDPFAPYEAIMPGQPTTALAQLHCQFHWSYYPDDPSTACWIYPSEGVIKEVSIQFYNDKIWQAVFKVEGLRVGDLVQRWGYPDFDNNNGIFLSLQGHEEMEAILALSSPMGRFSFLLPVYALILRDDED